MTNQKRNLDFALLARVIGLAKPYTKLFFLTGLLAIVIAPVSVLRPHLINLMVDDYILQYNLSGLKTMAIWFMLVVLLTVLLRYVFIYTTALLGQNVVRDLRVRVFNHISSLSLRHFDLTPIGKSTTRTINDIETINNIFTQGMITMLADILGIFAVIGIMFYTSWQLTLVCLSTLPLLIIATYIFKEKVKVAFQKVRMHIATMNAFLQERITGMQIVQIFNAEAQEQAKFRKINRAYTQANLDSILYYAIFFPVVEIIHYGTLALIVWLGAEWFVKDTVSFGAIVAFPIYIGMLYRPVRMLADKFNTLQMGLVAAERVFSVLDNQNKIKDYGKVQVDKIKGDVEFNHVSFSYDDETYVLNDISFKLEAGKSLAVIGSTGSGKTTIINILNRFYDIQKGEILIDGIDQKKYDLKNLRERIAMVLQDVFLFNGTVFENITLKDDSIDLETVRAAATKIGAEPFIEKLPGGYDFEVMERGANLSMGQRQLISFVRALVFDPDILILDEATSSIDTETESIIQFAIEKLIEKRSSIIIAHRLSTIRHVDHIIVMDQGRMIEYGTHDELISNEEGKYKKLYEMQFINAATA